MNTRSAPCGSVNLNAVIACTTPTEAFDSVGVDLDLAHRRRYRLPGFGSQDQGSDKPIGRSPINHTLPLHVPCLAIAVTSNETKCVCHNAALHTTREAYETISLAEGSGCGSQSGFPGGFVVDSLSVTFCPL